MNCCVPSCNNSKNTLDSQKVTYHKFPVDKYLRAAWFAALGLENSQLSDAPVVCSLHFKDSNFYNGKNGLKNVQRGAVPFVQVCMICLDTNRKLYPLDKYNLEKAYETLTGLYLQQIQSCLTPSVCSECALRLTKCCQFRDKSLRAHVLLLDLFQQHELLTVPYIRTINRSNFGLKSNITQKSFRPNHCDLHVIDDSYIEIEIEPKENKSKVKFEDQDEIVITSDPKITNESQLQENDSLIDITKLNTIKSDLNDDIDIDIDFLNDENDDGFVNNDDDNESLDETHEVLKEKTLNVSLNNLTTDDIEVALIGNEDENDVELVDDDINKRLPEDEMKDVKGTRKVNLNTKNVRNKTQTSKKAATKKAAPKTKKAPKTEAKPENKKINKTPINQVLTLFEMTKLTHQEQLEEINKRKESKNYLNSSYRCDVCYRGFISKTTYTRHMEKHSKSYGDLQCPVCKQYLKARHALHQHIRTRHSTRYSCTACDFHTMNCEAARMHQFWHKGTKYKCTQCDGEFIKNTSYLTHLRVKHPSDYICSQCGYSYLSEKGLLSHIARIHRLDRVENPAGPRCEECSVRFASDAAYEQHLRVSPKHHTPETRAVNQALPQRSNRRGGGARTLDDDDCVTCEQCGVRLKDYAKYMFHFRREHPDKVRTQYAPRPRAVLCELCGKSCQDQYTLRYHMTKHTGQKDFQCDVCEKRFRIKWFLDLHKKIHEPREARRRYSCSVCDKSFTSPSSLSRHAWIHKGKSFKCEVCDKAFSNPSERNCHVSHVHMKVPWPKRQRGPNKARRPSLTNGQNKDE